MSRKHVQSFDFKKEQTYKQNYLALLDVQYLSVLFFYHALNILNTNMSIE